MESLHRCRRTPKTPSKNDSSFGVDRVRLYSSFRIGSATTQFRTAYQFGASHSLRWTPPPPVQGPDKVNRINLQ